MPQRKKGYYTKLDPELREAMRRYKKNVGVPEAQHVAHPGVSQVERRRVARAPERELGQLHQPHEERADDDTDGDRVDAEER